MLLILFKLLECFSYIYTVHSKPPPLGTTNTLKVDQNREILGLIKTSPFLLPLGLAGNTFGLGVNFGKITIYLNWRVISLHEVVNLSVQRVLPKQRRRLC